MKSKIIVAIGSVILALAITILLLRMNVSEPRTAADLRNTARQQNLVVFANDNWSVWANFRPIRGTEKKCGGPYYNSRLYLNPYNEKALIRIPGHVDYRLFRAGHRSGIDWVFSNRTVVSHHEGRFGENSILLYYQHANGQTNRWVLKMPEKMRSPVYSQSTIVAASDNGAVVAILCNCRTNEYGWSFFIIPWNETTVAPDWTTTSVVDGKTNAEINCSNVIKIVSIPHCGVARYPLVHWKGDWIATLSWPNKVLVYNVATKERDFVQCPTKEISCICMLDSSKIIAQELSQKENCFVIHLSDKSVRPADLDMDAAYLNIMKNLSRYGGTFVQRERIL